MPGVTSLKRGPERRAQCRRLLRRADDAVEAAGRGEPREAQRLLRPCRRRCPMARRSASPRLVSTVTAISSGLRPAALRRGGVDRRRAPPRASRAPPAACTFSIHTPRRVAAAQACATVFGMSWNLRSRKTRKPRATIQRTGSGPATTNISLPTLSAQAAGSRRSASASACIGLAKSSATITRGSDES